MEILTVYYCQVCKLPPEYCSYGPSAQRCRQQLEEDNKELFQQLYDPNAVVEKEDKKPKKQKEVKKQVKVQMQERTRKKRITVVTGMETFDLDLKKAAKTFSSKFACGASVTKTASGTEEIVIQGDFEHEIVGLLGKEFSIAESDIVILDAKKK
ncbi:translation machinery-associated protein 22 [Gorgonomyces haynaldii]|nr:translation machinery-associated protein 22 [Gorgonomyces haynaldii]